MTASKREYGRRTGVASLTDSVPVRTAVTPEVGTLRRSRCLTYRFTGSPARRISGESATTTGHVASAIDARLTASGRLPFIATSLSRIDHDGPGDGLTEIMSLIETIAAIAHTRSAAAGSQVSLRQRG
jgi:hypothetical protein